MIHLTSAIGSQVTSAGGVVLRCSSAKRAGSSTNRNRGRHCPARPHTPETRPRLTSASPTGQVQQDDTRQRRTSTQRLTPTQGLTHHAVSPTHAGTENKENE